MPTVYAPLPLGGDNNVTLLRFSSWRPETGLFLLPLSLGVHGLAASPTTVPGRGAYSEGAQFQAASRALRGSIRTWPFYPLILHVGSVTYSDNINKSGLMKHALLGSHGNRGCR